jgi:hypothetical protein
MSQPPPGRTQTRIDVDRWPTKLPFFPSPAAAIVLCIALGACGDSSGPPGPGTVRIVVATTGSDLDPDGYTVAIGAQSGTVGVNDSLTFDDTPSGPHQVTLSSIAPNCSATTTLPVQVTVTPGEVSRVSITMTCSALTGILRVATQTTGRDLDPDGYTVSVDGGPATPIGANSVISFPNLAPGSHALQIEGAAANCTLSAPPAATVVARGETVVTVQVVCAGPLRDAIVFTKFTGGAEQLFFVNTDGSGLQQLTFDVHPYFNPAVSPDGLHIAVVTTRPEGGTGGLFVMRNDGRDLRPVVTIGDRVGKVVWTRDGRIAFAQAPSYPMWPDLCFVKPDGTDRVCVVPEDGNLFFGDFSLSPDASQVVYTAGSDFIFMNTDGTNYHVFRGTAENYRPDWSPDGQRIAYQHVEDVDGDGQLNSDIYVMNIDGSNPVRLTTDNVKHASPRWSPDGRQILYESWSVGNGESELRIMDADGSNIRKLTVNGSGEGSGVWSPVQ